MRIVDTMTFEEFLSAGVDQFSQDLTDLISRVFAVKRPDINNPDPDVPDDTLTIFTDIQEYLKQRYNSFEVLYPEFNTFDRLLCASLKTNALEFAKVITVWRSARLEYQKLLIGDSANNSMSVSYSGLNATGTYTTTTNDAKSVNVFDTLSKMVNRAQSEVYLFLDRIIQPYLKITY